MLYQSILNTKLTGRKRLGRKMYTSNRDDRKLENTVKQSRFKHLGELHKEWTEAGVSHQESPRSDIFRKRATKPLWTVAQWSKVLFSDESKFCISFGNQVPESGGEERRGTESCCLKSVWSFHSQWWLGCHVIYWSWTTVVFCPSPQSTQHFQSSIECIEMNILFGNLHLCLKYPFLLDVIF